MQGVLTPAIALWVFGSPGGLPSPIFGSVSGDFITPSKWGCDSHGGWHEFERSVIASDLWRMCQSISRKIVFCNLSYATKKCHMQLFCNYTCCMQLQNSCIRQDAKDYFSSSEGKPSKNIISQGQNNEGFITFGDCPHWYVRANENYIGWWSAILSHFH
jgi:hypothetical protein